MKLLKTFFISFCFPTSTAYGPSPNTTHNYITRPTAAVLYLYCVAYANHGASYFNAAKCVADVERINKEADGNGASVLV